MARLRMLTVLMVLMLVSIAAVGCGDDLPDPTVTPSTKAASKQLTQLQSALTDAGLKVEVGDPHAKPPFWYQADYQLVKVEDQPLQTFAFASKKDAEVAAKGVSDDGLTIDMGVGGGLLDLKWTAPPHFFRKDDLIVVYVDELARTDKAKSAKILDALRGSLGQEFAEGPPLKN